MAKIIHFSCFLTRPCSLPSPLFRRTQFPGNFGQSFEDVNGAVEIHHLLQERGKQSLLRCQMPEGKRVLERISSHYDELNALEGGFWLRVPVTAFLAANILIFTAPMKALAETCEADNSFFNMPLLLFVALIGATVGGIFLLSLIFGSGP
ncbi:hypothetical protein Godav_008618 [Gossypium davidsonii]|uniref:Uncharacterized protein n=2 Tax=Gossypium TaxID=3633 RepID=A0A7J8SB47_GOSDV|nr:hypothetical protein [Gossypium davidsonii]